MLACSGGGVGRLPRRSRVYTIAWLWQNWLICAASSLLERGRFDIGRFWFDVALAGNNVPRFRSFIDAIASNSIIYSSCNAQSVTAALLMLL
jgi:hypothetical protein